MSKSNVQLQLRGGKNYPGYPGVIFAGSSAVGFKLKASDTVVLEGVAESRTLASYYIADPLEIVNSTGAGIEARLYFVDKYGGEILTDQATINAGNSGELEFDNAWILSEGEKLVLRIIGDITAGEGVHVCRKTIEGGEDFVARQENDKISQIQVEYLASEGHTFLELSLKLFNFSPTTDINWEHKQIFPDGFSRVVASGTLLHKELNTPNQLNDIVLLASDNIKAVVVFNMLPADGYLYGGFVGVIQNNIVEATPAVEDL